MSEKSSRRRRSKSGGRCRRERVEAYKEVVEKEKNDAIVKNPLSNRNQKEKGNGKSDATKNGPNRSKENEKNGRKRENRFEERGRESSGRGIINKRGFGGRRGFGDRRGFGVRRGFGDRKGYGNRRGFGYHRGDGEFEERGYKIENQRGRGGGFNKGRGGHKEPGTVNYITCNNVFC
ncbi:uncharacterized protein LOC122505313 [Leptopilina heterotoma]|uniref:uncharacterized protein LOC122505312 n=1 Tax=Leptopilina heterotoma TaxID=63436 RepID=UPI001CA8757B|nr:uncharacterized protein LOC122505312 [Leptopilina heterotoma]XP_043472760.1 uncharacterized protein LOC122505313 [Leptopilina heterotoma]